MRMETVSDSSSPIVADPARSATAENSDVNQSLLSYSSLSGNDVVNQENEDLGDIKDCMLDMRTGRVCYAVLAFGGFLGMGEKLFAVPWTALSLDRENKRFVLNVTKDRLKEAPGFDKDAWPNMADPAWAESIHSYYGTRSDRDGPTV